MNTLISILIRFGLLKEDLDYHLLRASMVIIFLAFGYQKWFEYEAQVLIPYISNGPLIFWMYPVFGIRGASWFLGIAEWLFGARHSYRPSPSSRSCRTAGIRLPGFRRWRATSLSWRRMRFCWLYRSIC
jgi:hypothetical protein